MRRDLTSAVIAVVVFTLLFGLGYPLLVTGVSQLAFYDRANGSRVNLAGKVVGSRLIGQDFRGNPRYFHSRPSTATRYAADASAFTNLGPNSKDARKTFAMSLKTYLARESRYDPGLTATAVPVDAVTSSASGVDPHISQANAAIQAHRVAAIRHVSLAVVDRLVKQYTDHRFLGLFGEPGVNVLELNLALDRQLRR
jgi:K+-transporting ATPase ATPase C chain